MGPQKAEMEYSKFLAGYAKAVKARDRDALADLFSKWVKCKFCGKLVDADKTLQRGGSLVCPSCGKYWVERTPPKQEMEYAKFLPGYVMAAKAGDRAELTKLLGKWVKCNFCGDLVFAAKTMRKGGSLICPSCGKYWVKWGKG